MTAKLHNTCIEVRISTICGSAGNMYIPFNAATGKHYNGLNIGTLEARAEELHGLEDPRWLTFLQAKELGYKVKKGAKGVKVTFWKIEEDKENDKTRRILKFYTVFHASQIEGIPPYVA